MQGSPEHPGAVPCLLAGMVMMDCTVPESAQTAHKSALAEVRNAPVSLTWLITFQQDEPVAGSVSADAGGRVRLGLPGATP
jgi:hypothetical protein